MATTVAAVDAGRQLVADVGAPPPPPPAGAAAAAAASAPAAAAASTPAAAGEAAASTGDQLQEQAQTIMMETMDEMRKMKESMQELKAMVEAQKKASTTCTALWVGTLSGSSGGGMSLPSSIAEAA